MDKVILPEENGEYKFILVYVEGQLYVRFGSKDGYHNDILDKFIEKSKLSKGDLQVSGGYCTVNKEEKTLKFHGESSAYGPADPMNLMDALKDLDYACLFM
ncbi:MAG: hypothetical protein ABIJ92_01075 [Candidatus Aenigmatarchaeota archaeon]